MVNNPEVLALIPARGGSKGIPRKNINLFAGYPLIVYSIIAGLRSKLVNRVIVTTDDQEIAAIAKDWGADVPFLRPSALAENDTTDFPVMSHCLNWLLDNEGYQPKIIIWLRPTSPIRPIKLIDDAIGLLSKRPEADSIRGVVRAGQTPYKMWHIDEKFGVIKPLIKLADVDEPYNAPRQSLPEVYWQTGHIDAIRYDTITRKKTATGDVIFPLLINEKFTVDLDVPDDWSIAERKFLKYHNEIIDPAKLRRSMPDRPKLLVLDFDGVMTDNRVWVNEFGQESVASNRSDSLGLEMVMKETNLKVLVLSRETNPVVTARCKKLGIDVFQSINDKQKAIQMLMKENNVLPSETIFMGNDINDLEVFPEVGYAVSPVDAHHEVLRQADLVLTSRGGHGAVRELSDLLLSRIK